MEELLKQANENIEHLVNKIISMDKEENQRYCKGLPEGYDSCDDLDCNKCKYMYFEKKRKMMIEKYQVKEAK